MPPRSVIGFLLLAWLLLGAGGCSFLFVDGPPATHRQLSFFSCSSSNALPTIDLVLGAAAAVGSVAPAALGSTGSNGSSAEIVGAAEAVLLGASAIYGYKKTSECREAQADLFQRLQRGPAFEPPSGYRQGFGVSAGPGVSPAASGPYDPWITPGPPAPRPPAPTAGPPPLGSTAPPPVSTPSIAPGSPPLAPEAK